MNEFEQMLDNPKMQKELERFQNKISYRFKTSELLVRAVTHKSFVNNKVRFKRAKHNERLEFLGDSVLGLIITDYLFEKYPDTREGPMTKIKSFIVSRGQLGEIAKKLRMDKVMLFSEDEKVRFSRKYSAVLSDAFEALVGAIYLDGGLEEARKFVLNRFDSVLASLDIEDLVLNDYKSIVQQIAQKEMQVLPVYNIIKEKGPEHNKTFVVQLEIEGVAVSRGSGHSKKRAEQKAAEKAYKVFGKRWKKYHKVKSYLKTLKKSK